MSLITLALVLLSNFFMNRFNKDVYNRGVI